MDYGKIKLLDKIKRLKKGKVKDLVDKRIKGFKQIKGSSVFKELCFCILTANSTAERCISVQSKVGDGFLNLPKSKLQKKLKNYGCRFHTKRADYISDARKHKNNLKKILKKDDRREWLVENIKGLGMKEASHFLRNIGFFDYAIIDFHIIDILVNNKLIKRPKVLNKKAYLEIEEVLRGLTSKAGMNLGKLDLYLWYMETGKVLK